jgi:hypothetical protein
MKDLKLALKRGYDLNELSKVVNLLEIEKLYQLNTKIIH